MWRTPDVVTTRGHSKPLIDLSDPSQTDEAFMSSPPPFNPRPGVRTEGTKRPEQTAETDTALAAALKRAQAEKDRKREEEKEADRQHKADRADALREAQTIAAEKSEWAAIEAAEDAAEEAEAADRKRRVQETAERLRASAPAPKTVAQSAQIQDIEDAILETASQMGAPKKAPPQPSRPVETPQPEDSRRLPDYLPRVSRPSPDDPRVANGTLVPSARVAEHIAHKPNPTPTPPPRSPIVAPAAEWEHFLAHGNLVQIMAGRKPETLTGRDREAYERVLATGTHQDIMAGRKLADLPARELEAYYEAIGRASAAARIERWGTASPAKIREIKMAQGLIDRPTAAPDTPPWTPAQATPTPRKKTAPKMKAKPEAARWVHRLVAAMKRKNINGFALSEMIGRAPWWLRDSLRVRQHPNAKPLPLPAREKIAEILGMRKSSLLNEDFDPSAPGLSAEVEHEEDEATHQPSPENVAILDEALGRSSRADNLVEVDGVRYLPSYAIEDNVPMPPPPGLTVWGFSSMRVGQSFAVPIDHTGRAAVLAKVEKAVAKFTKTSDWTFQVAERPGEVRCWRMT